MCRNIIALVLVWFFMIRSSLVWGGATNRSIRLEHVAGKLVVLQKQGNVTYVRRGELASEVPTQTRFELDDPGNALRDVRFSYIWDLGNGEVIKGSESSVQYNYSCSGNYTLQLKVGALFSNTCTPLTGVHMMDLTVLDAIKTIEFKGPSRFQIFRNNSLDVYVDGSPPISVCWRFLYNCVPAYLQSCHLTTLYENTLRLHHIFTAPGVHCLDISAHNNISQKQMSYSIFVWRDPVNNLLFILPCTGIILSILAFITIVVCKPKKEQKNKPGISASSNATYSSMNMELQPKQDFRDIRSDLNNSIEDKGERYFFLSVLVANAAQIHSP
ncbi:hypothetical protein DPEC_G00357410 [Dallia pectoralis]|uniref:Uncharacterized protein n=1 Tax=Dallia pectoralis TaxID=75939 RepID=A0ACC2F017_DALPE|nr:hypothetical protein DPEC_G00357410 [Dallia pectoralis]